MQRQRSAFPPLEPGQPPGTHSWPGACPPWAQSHPHLVNRTVPCSSGLRFTASQLCRISSGSGRSMLAQERKAGTLWARDRHRRCPAISEATRPRRTPGSPSGGAPTLPAPLALLGTLLRQQLPAPRASECPALHSPELTDGGALKQPRPRPLRPSKRASLGKALAQTTWWHGQCPSELHRNHGAGIEFDRLGQALHEPLFHKPLSNIS